LVNLPKEINFFFYITNLDSLFKKKYIYGLSRVLCARLYFEVVNAIGDFNIKNTEVVFSIDDFNINFKMKLYTPNTT